MMQFTLRSMLVVVAIAALVCWVVLYREVEDIVFGVPTALCLIAFWYLRKKGRAKSGWSVLGFYLVLWFITCVFGPASVHDRFARGVRDPASEDRTKYFMSFSPRRRFFDALELDERPWHFLEVVSTPCPLIVIADEGVNHGSVASGSRVIILWVFGKSYCLTRLGYWHMH